MIGINYLAVVVATVAAFIASAAWYVLFSKQRAKLSNVATNKARPSPWTMLAELFRAFVLAVILAGLVAQLGIADWVSAVRLGLVMWIGFPLILLLGSVMYERVPWKLAAIHSGDWLVKLLLMIVIIGVWR